MNGENGTLNGRSFSSESDESRRQSTQERQVNFDGNGSLSLVNGSSVLNEYRSRLPRRKGRGRKAAEGCWGLSSSSWVFLLLALLQFASVTGLQIAISVLGGFGGRLDDYVICLENSIGTEFKTNFSIPANTTFPTFGEDKQIYIYFFIVLVLYNFLLCIYALKQQNIIEVFAFMVLNILAMAYACLQVYQFRGFGSGCDVITNVGYIALANVMILLVFTTIFLLLSLNIYKEFGWKTYRLLNCNPAMRYYYRVYDILMSAVKILLLFMFLLTVGQCILILTPGNYEFGLTILFAFALLFVVYPVIYLVVTNEFIVGYVGMFIAVFLVGSYSLFKMVRFATVSCPLCKDRVSEVELQREIILNQTRSQGIQGDEDRLIQLLNLDRVEDFANLTMLASLCLIFAIAATIVFIHHLRFYNKGLKDYFDSQQPNLYLNQHCFRTCHKYRTRYDVTDGPKKGKTLNLTMAYGKKHKPQDSQKSTRDSRIEDTLSSPRHSQPDFNTAAHTVPDHSQDEKDRPLVRFQFQRQ